MLRAQAPCTHINNRCATTETQKRAAPFGAALLVYRAVTMLLSLFRRSVLLGGLLLGGFERLLHPVVGFLDIRVVLFLGVVQIRTIANQEVHIGHGVLILWIDAESLLL